MDISGYQIIRELGKGGMATVYLAIQQSFGREVALKVMAPALSSDPDFHERFLREARIVSRLIHPHIVTVHDVGEHNGHHYISMEYIRGQDLRHRRDLMSLFERVRVVRDVASALDYASSKGYVHRDVKPDNIMIRDEDGRAVLMDFGIARTAETDLSMTQTGTVIGTPQYMSPEQARGHKVDHRSDIYSLGVVLFQSLIGHVPFTAETPVAVALKHLTEPVPRLPDGLRIFQPVIDKALAKAPEERFQRGLELAAALDLILDAYDRRQRARREAGPRHASRDEESGEVVAPGAELRRPGRPDNDAANTEVAMAMPEELRRARHRKAKSPVRRWLMLLLMAVAGLAGAHYAGWLQGPLDQLLARLPVPADVVAGAGVAERGAAAQVTPPPSPPAVIEQPAERPPVVAVAPPIEPPADAQPLSTEGVEPPKTDPLRESLRARAAELEAQVATDLAVAPQLAQLYRLVLEEQPDEPWAQAGLENLLTLHGERVAAYLDEGALEEAAALLAQVAGIDPQSNSRGPFPALIERLQRAERLARLMAEGESLLGRDALTAPPGENAAERFRAVLEIDPGHDGARAGLRRIAARYAALARGDMARNELEQASSRVERGLGVVADHEGLLALRDNLAERLRRKREIDRLIASAVALEETGRLTEPDGDNAYVRYRDVLALAPGNRDATAGLGRIARRLEQEVELAVGAGEFDRGAEQLEAARERFPDRPIWSQLGTRLEIAREEARRAVEEATRPRVSRVVVSGAPLNDMAMAPPELLAVDRTLHIGFSYGNFPEGTVVVQAVLFDGARTLQIAQIPVIVSGREGVQYFRIDRPVEGFAEGGYNLDLVLEGRPLASSRFQVGAPRGG